MRYATVAVCISFGMVAAGIAQQARGPGSDADPDPAIVEKIEELGGRVSRLAQNDPGLEVSFHLGRGPEGLRLQEDSNAENSEPPSITSGLALLKGLKSVLSLHLGGTDVTDEGLRHLAGLTSLKRLHLEKTKLSDAGLAHLANLESLSYLNLYGTAVTDAGLEHLAGLKNLKNLYLWQTEVTTGGVEQLQQALPDCNINVGWELQEEAETEAEPEPEA